MGAFCVGYIFGGAFGYYAASAVSAFRAEINYPIRGADYFGVVLDYQEWSPPWSDQVCSNTAKSLVMSSKWRPVGGLLVADEEAFLRLWPAPNARLVLRAALHRLTALWRTGLNADSPCPFSSSSLRRVASLGVSWKNLIASPIEAVALRESSGLCI